jgi:hypothetical protein
MTAMTTHDMTEPIDPRAGEIASLRGLLRREMEQRIEAHLLPYEGRWLTREQVEAKLGGERRRARTQAIELLVLFALLAGVSVLMLELLRSLAG